MKRITNINNKNVITIKNNHAMINNVNYSSNVTLYNFISNELDYLNNNIETIKNNLTDKDKDGATDA